MSTARKFNFDPGKFPPPEKAKRPTARVARDPHDGLPLSPQFVRDAGEALADDERKLREFLASWSAERIGTAAQCIMQGPYDNLTKLCVSIALGRVVHERDMAVLESVG